ncbi:KH domain-containing protein [Helicobacter sp. 13S00477-4]|uniref:KH domain-containing protein n=1 Tax=Helicobacter sp. 13S00477-4 TaxID=1905759 RepID=UPI000BA5C0D4|nr:KH domain-containing protein [Helicobacter sp. 13S00477-4]PAF52363.1 RNA-binding protein [Helicobacter sp. 13S00477-4]
MVEKFLENYVKKIVQHPNEVSVSIDSFEEGYKDIVIYTSSLDMGKIIGKDGRMISALKTFISGAKAKDGFTYRIVVESNDSQQ